MLWCHRELIGGIRLGRKGAFQMDFGHIRDIVRLLGWGKVVTARGQKALIGSVCAVTSVIQSTMWHSGNTS